jgi:hypothetical protein
MVYYRSLLIALLMFVPISGQSQYYNWNDTLDLDISAK